jgi:esterase/lipase superfamily enzyme
MATVFFATNRQWDGFSFTEEADEAGHFGHASGGTAYAGLPPDSHGGDFHVQFTCRASFLSATRPFKRLFLFSPGFNNTFQSGVQALLSYSTALQDEGLAETAFVLLSWPSQRNDDGLLAFFKTESPYAADRLRARESGRFFGRVINDLNARVEHPQQQLLIFGHSMGAYMLWAAFRWIDRSDLIDAVLFVAADITVRAEKKRETLRSLRSVTNYYCRKDHGLICASVIGKHGRRVGSRAAAKGVVNIEVPPELAARADSAMHSYFQDIQLVHDVVQRCMGAHNPADRGLAQTESGWEMATDPRHDVKEKLGDVFAPFRT